tara:strand:- start:6648 stop:6941 length:294 start_codon:yes stop_codon:yes gene_type:complete
MTHLFIGETVVKELHQHHVTLEQAMQVLRDEVYGKAIHGDVDKLVDLYEWANDKHFNEYHGQLFYFPTEEYNSITRMIPNITPTIAADMGLQLFLTL